MSTYVSISKPAYEWLSDRANEMGTSVEDELNNAIALSMRLDGYRVMNAKAKSNPSSAHGNNIEHIADEWSKKVKGTFGEEKIGASKMCDLFLHDADVTKMQISQTAFGRIASRHFQKKRYAEGYYYLV